jgi:hypothetical protein
MSEALILVCDVCGDSASTTVTLKIGRRSLWKDLCDAHLADLMEGGRAVRRGRPRGVARAAAPRDLRATAGSVGHASTRQRGRPTRAVSRG